MVEPDKHYSEMELPGIGKIQEGSDGSVAWTMSAMQGPRVKEGDERAESLLQGKFNGELNWRDIYSKAETTGTEDVDGKTCYKVLLTPKQGPVATKWFDKDTGFLVKSATTSKTPMGEVQAETTHSDYRKEGDLMVAHKMNTKVATMELSMTVDSVQSNPEIPKDKFDPPAEVKALIKKPEAK
jgi:outer membrane lipoprotein-sorting protein